MVNYLRKAVLGIGFVFAFSMFSMLSAYFIRLVLARGLTPEEYGLFYAVQGFVLLVINFSDPGLRYALVKFVSSFSVERAADKINRAISSTVLVWTLFSGVLALIIIASSGFLAEHYFKSADAQLITIILAIGIALYCIDFYGFVLQGMQRMALFASTDFIRNLFILVFCFVGLQMFKSPLVPALAYGFAPILLTIIFFPILKLKVFPELKFAKFDLPLLKQMSWFGLPLMVTAFSFSFFQQSTILILTYFKSLTDVGLLSVALPTSALLITVSAALANVVFPMTSELWARGYKEHLKEGMTLLYRYSLMAILPLSLVMGMYATLVISILFGADYINAASSLRILSVGTLFWVLANINFNVLAGIDKSREPLKIMLFINIISVILSCALIPFYGVMGAAISISVSYALALFASVYKLRNHIPIQFPWLSWLKTGVAGTVFIGVIYGLKAVLVHNVIVEAVITVAVAGIAYLIVLLLLKATSYSEIKGYLNRVLAK